MIRSHAQGTYIGFTLIYSPLSPNHGNKITEGTTMRKFFSDESPLFFLAFRLHLSIRAGTKLCGPSAASHAFLVPTCSRYWTMKCQLFNAPSPPGGNMKVMVLAHPQQAKNANQLWPVLTKLASKLIGRRVVTGGGSYWVRSESRTTGTPPSYGWPRRMALPKNVRMMTALSRLPPRR